MEPSPGGNQAQCACSVRAVRLFWHLAILETHTLWYKGHHCCLITRILVLLLHRIRHFWGFTHFTPIFSYFRSPHVRLSRLKRFSPHYGSPQCGHSASASIDLHPASDAIVKVKINMQMTSVQMKINHNTKSSSIIRGCMVGKCALCVVLYHVVAELRWVVRLSLMTLAGVLLLDPKELQRFHGHYFMASDGKGR